MKIDPSVQRALDDGTLSHEAFVQATWTALEAMLRDGFAGWARARGDADDAKIARCAVKLDRLLREGKAQMLRPRPTSVQ